MCCTACWHGGRRTCRRPNLQRHGLGVDFYYISRDSSLARSYYDEALTLARRYPSEFSGAACARAVRLRRIVSCDGRRGWARRRTTISLRRQRASLVMTQQRRKWRDECGRKNPSPTRLNISNAGGRRPLVSGAASDVMMILTVTTMVRWLWNHDVTRLELARALRLTWLPPPRGRAGTRTCRGTRRSTPNGRAPWASSPRR